MTLRTKGEQKAYLDGYEMCANCVEKYLTDEGKQKLECLLMTVRNAIEAAEQPEERTEERTESHACDCISRQAVIESIETDCSWDIFNEWGSRTPTGESIIEAIKRVPSVEPERKTGKWIYTENHCWICSECGKHPLKGTGFTPTLDGMRIQWKFCNMCGAKMEVDG